MENNSIYLNPNHPLIKDQSITLDQIKDFFNQNKSNANILKVKQVYEKLLSRDSIINDDNVNNITNYAKDIFENFISQDNYKNIDTCGNQLKTHLRNDSIVIKQDARFALQAYISYLVKCSKIKVENNGDSENENLKNNFNAVFSQDLKVCAGGIGSAFMNAMSGGIANRIIEEYAKKFIEYIPSNMETHLRPFFINIFDKKMEDVHKDAIPNYLTREELKNLVIIP